MVNRFNVWQPLVLVLSCLVSGAGRVSAAAEVPAERGGMGQSAPTRRLLVINPNTSAETTEAIAANARRYARPGTEITAIKPDEGPTIIMGYFENQIATAQVLRAVERLDPSSYDAIIVAAYSDAGLYGLRELVDVPVVGIAEASMLMAHPLGHKFSIVSFIERMRPFFEDMVALHGFQDRLASIRLVEIPAAELRDAAGLPNPKLLDAARAAIDEDGAEVILLGGATLTGLDKALQAAVGVPVIDGVAAAVTLAEAILDYGVPPSKVRAFRTPESKRRR